MSKKISKKDKINRKDFLEVISKMYDIDLNTLTKCYNAISEGIVMQVLLGHSVNLTGFGRFYLQTHKGHSVQFKKERLGNDVPDYQVLKFSTAYTLNKKMRSGVLDSEIKKRFDQ